MAELTVREQMAEALEGLAQTMREQLASLIDAGKVNAGKTHAAFTDADAALARHRAEPEGCLCCTHECGPECDCWNAGHQAGTEAQREPAGRGTA